MPRKSLAVFGLALIALAAIGPLRLAALDPHKAVSQYTRAVWTQAEGLPQDSIRAVAQTNDGYLWLGTDEGLARFDGYEFVTFTKDGGLPGNSITALAAGKDGALWIGTPDGLASYRDRHFTLFKTGSGLPDNAVTSLSVDNRGTLWITSGVSLTSYEGGRFTTYPAAALQPLQAVRIVYESPQHELLATGPGGLVKLDNGKFVPLLGPREMENDFPTALLKDRMGNVWLGTNHGLLSRSPDGKLKRFVTRDGLQDDLIRALWEDRSGNLWVGTNAGLSRLEGRRFVRAAMGTGNDRDWVRSLFEDRESNLWVAMNNGLYRFRDDQFTNYGRGEGWPSDEPTAVHQDRKGNIWVGYNNDGVAVLENGKVRAYTSRDGLPDDEIFSIRQGPGDDILVSTRDGLAWMHDGKFSTYIVPDPLNRATVFDTLVDRQGQLWVATTNGLNKRVGSRFENVIPGGRLLNGVAVALAEGNDGSIWAGTYGEGLWRVDGDRHRQFTTASGLSDNQIHSLYQDPDGTLWIGTYGGGLNAYRNGSFSRYTSKNGILSDNIAHIEDDGSGSLWLSTTRGICRVSKKQLQDFTAGRIKILTPTNYGIADGLRSAQAAPGYPSSSGGARSSDGRLWFPTSRGLAVIDPGTPAAPPEIAPQVRMTQVDADGTDVEVSHFARLRPGLPRLLLRYGAIHLSAPDRVRYEYKLEGFDQDWISAGARRAVNYTSLRYGEYRFLVRASLPGGEPTEAAFDLEVMPYFYQTRWFRWLWLATVLAAIYGMYKLRMRKIRGRFSLVLDERVRMAREIHDTLAQGFVGISSQLDAVAVKIRPDDAARRHLELAQKMARHSLTEARRSVMDLRASALETGDLSTALSAAARQWTAGRGLTLDLDIGAVPYKLSEDYEQNLLRIAQEAVNNVMKHAQARNARIVLRAGADRLFLTISDDGLGFEPRGAFASAEGRFGLLGMRERAARLGGELELSSEPGKGTQVEVSVPISGDYNQIGGPNASRGIFRRGIFRWIRSEWMERWRPARS